MLKSGNMVSIGVLTALGFWGIDVLVTTRNDRPIAVLKNLEDDSYVKTRISQYETLKNGKGIIVAKRIVYANDLPYAFFYARATDNLGEGIPIVLYSLVDPYGYQVHLPTPSLPIQSLGLRNYRYSP